MQYRDSRVCLALDIYTELLALLSSSPLQKKTNPKSAVCRCWLSCLRFYFSFEKKCPVLIKSKKRFFLEEGGEERRTTFSKDKKKKLSYPTPKVLLLSEHQ
jgi:hypothetical protein